MDNYGEGLLGRIAMLEDDLHAMTQARDDALRYCETLQADADKVRMKTNYCPSCKGYADRIAALEAENARLREALEEWVFRYNWRVDGMNVEQARIHARVFVQTGIGALKAWREVTDQLQE